MTVTIEASALWTTSSATRESSHESSPRPFLSITDRQPARGDGQDRAVQLGLRPSPAGAFVFRIEDTDSARDSEQSYQALVDTLRWLHLDWDEGPEVGWAARTVSAVPAAMVYERTAAQLIADGRLSLLLHPEERNNAAGGAPGSGRRATREPVGHSPKNRWLGTAMRAAAGGPALYA